LLPITYTEGGVRREGRVLVRDGALPAAPMPTAADPANGLLILDLGVAEPARYTALQTQLGTRLTVDAASPPGLRFASGTSATIEGLARIDVGRTPPAVGGGYPLFTDPNAVDSSFGGVHPLTERLTGLAQRLSVNGEIVRDPALVNGRPGAGVLAGDPTRANALLDNLTKVGRTFSAQTGVGGTGAPYRASVSDFSRRVIETQANDAEAASRLDEGQRIALASVESRFAQTSGVNIDEEMSQLVQLQTAYGANARVMTAVRDMLDMLMRI
jgi:flagellar hook-associated protein 1 FlgK